MTSENWEVNNGKEGMACFKGGLYPEVGVPEAPNDDEVWLGHIGQLTSTRETLGDTWGFS